jgi:hypothetical protein
VAVQWPIANLCDFELWLFTPEAQSVKSATGVTAYNKLSQGGNNITNKNIPFSSKLIELNPYAVCCCSFISIHAANNISVLTVKFQLHYQKTMKIK